MWNPQSHFIEIVFVHVTVFLVLTLCRIMIFFWHFWGTCFKFPGFIAGDCWSNWKEDIIRFYKTSARIWQELRVRLKTYPFWSSCSRHPTRGNPDSLFIASVQITNCSARVCMNVWGVACFESYKVRDLGTPGSFLIRFEKFFWNCRVQ